MSGAKFLILGVAAVAGIGAVALVQSELDAARSAGDATVVVEETPKLEVLTASRSLRRGENFRNEALEWREWPADLVAEAFITSEERPDAMLELEQALAKTDIVEGAPVKDEQLIMLDHPGVLSAMLREGMRAFAISIAQETGAGGFVLPSDYVDVILTRDMEMYVCTPDGEYETKRYLKADTLVTTVRVLAVDTAFDAGEEASSAMERTATLEVSPEQAVLLSLAEQAGRLTLALRGISELIDDTGKPRDQLWPVTASKLDLAEEALAVAASARAGGAPRLAAFKSSISGDGGAPSDADATDGHGRPMKAEDAVLEALKVEATSARTARRTMTARRAPSSRCYAAENFPTQSCSEAGSRNAYLVARRRGPARHEGH